jgi:hypothetical protein
MLSPRDLGKGRQGGTLVGDCLGTMEKSKFADCLLVRRVHFIGHLVYYKTLGNKKKDIMSNLSSAGHNAFGKQPKNTQQTNTLGKK